MKFLHLYIAFILFLACKPAGEATTDPDGGNPPIDPATQKQTFTNPLLTAGADPWVMHKDGIYYYTHTVGNRIELRSTPRMENLAENAPVTIWTSPAGTPYAKQLWAPELHFLDGKWYLYFAATHNSGTDASLDENRRMFVLENASSSPMNNEWVFKGQVTDDLDFWSIDGSILELKGERYFMWSGWRSRNKADNSGIQQLYIAKMKNPYTLEGSRVMISEPTYSWERNGLVNEGPQMLKNDQGRVFVIYSCSGCWTDDYKLGVLSLKENGNPLDPAHWTKHPTPLFVKNPGKSVYAPGHNSFFKSPDGCEDWILYHANSNPGEGCGGKRSPRMQKISWDASGFPVLGTPEAAGVPLEVPSGK